LADRGSTCRCASATASDRSPFLDAAFHSPAAKANLAIRSRGRVKTPGLHLRNDLDAILDPFGLWAPVPVPPFCCLAGDDQCPEPVAKSSLKISRLSSSRRSPSGPFDPSGSKRSARLQPVTLTFTSCPIFLRSPFRSNILYRCETDRRSRSATSRQASLFGTGLSTLIPKDREILEGSEGSETNGESRSWVGQRVSCGERISQGNKRLSGGGSVGPNGSGKTLGLL